MEKPTLLKKTRIEKIVKRFISNSYKQASGKKIKKNKWVNKKRNSVKLK